MTKFQLRFKLQSLEQIEIPSQGSREFKWYFRVDRSQQDKLRFPCKIQKNCWGFTWVCFQSIELGLSETQTACEGNSSFCLTVGLWSLSCFLFFRWQKRPFDTLKTLYFFGFYGVFTGNRCFSHEHSTAFWFRWIPMSHVFVTSGFHH